MIPMKKAEVSALLISFWDASGFPQHERDPKITSIELEAH